MTAEELLKLYDKKLFDQGVLSKRAEDGLGLNHVAWMVWTTFYNLNLWPVTRTHRWIGFIQRGLLNYGVYTLAELREQSKGLDDEQVDPQTVVQPECYDGND
jgi:hypothetical protein